MTVLFEMFCRKSSNKAREISSSGKEALSSYNYTDAVFPMGETRPGYFFVWGNCIPGSLLFHY